MNAQGGKHLSAVRQTPECTRRVSSTSDAAESDCLAGHLHTWHLHTWLRVPSCSGRGFGGSASHPFCGCVFQPRCRVVLVKSLHLSEALTLSQNRQVVAHVCRGAVTGLSGVAEVKQQTQSGDCHQRGGDDSATSSSQDACSVMVPVLGKSTSLNGLSRLTAPTSAQRPQEKAQALLSKAAPPLLCTLAPDQRASWSPDVPFNPLHSSEGHLNVCVFVRIVGGFVFITSTSCTY